MKSRRILMLILGVSIFLSGCRRVPIENETADGDEEHQTTQHYTELKVVTNGHNRQILLYSAETETGYYELLMQPEEMATENSIWIHSGNILYTDYATRSRIYLCNTPGCLHNNANCTSYIQYPAMLTLFANASESKLFAMATGVSREDEIHSEDELGRIYQMELDGSNRVELFRLKANESFSLEDPVIADESHLFVMIAVFKDATREPTKELREIDLQTGEITTLLELPYQNVMVAAYDDTIVLSDYGRQPMTYQGYSLSKRSSDILYQGKGSLMPQSHYLFFVDLFDNGTGALRIYDLISKTEEVIKDIPQEAVASIYVGDYFDDKVHWSFVDTVGEGNRHEFVVDLKTGKAQEKELYYNQTDAGNQLIPIFAENDTCFLVAMGVTDSTITFTDTDGIPYTYDWPNKQILALILKEDYYSNNPNYIIIDDTVTDAVS